MRYEILEHTADIGIKAFGKDLSELYANAALGMFEIIFGRRATNSEERVTVEVDGMDAENLMVRWLSELLHLSREGWVFGGFEIKEINEQNLRAECRGKKHHQMLKPKTEIKLVTYHGLKVERSQEGCRAEIIFDV
jgi:SHS2 domain-containing protein